MMDKPATQIAGLKRAPALAILTAAISLASTLTACGPRTGDFGRPVADPVSFSALTRNLSETTANLFDPEAQAAAGLAIDRAITRAGNRILGEPAADFPEGSLSQVEHELRHRLWHFRQDIPDLPPTTPVARYNALTDAIVIDIQLLPRLVELRRLVADKDRIRAAALPAFEAAENREHRRVAEVARRNAERIAEICEHLRRRATGYRRFLEREVLAAPEEEAVTAERSLTRFDQVIRDVCDAAPGQAMAQPIAQPGRRATGRRARRHATQVGLSPPASRPLISK